MASCKTGYQKAWYDWNSGEQQVDLSEKKNQLIGCLKTTNSEKASAAWAMSSPPLATSGHRTAQQASHLPEAREQGLQGPQSPTLQHAIPKLHHSTGTAAASLGGQASGVPPPAFFSALFASWA